MTREITIGNHKIGDGHPTYLVAEIGINHNGDVEIAKSLIDVAARHGMNAVKFQKRTPELCVPPDQRAHMRETPWGYISYLDYRYKVEFGQVEYAEIDRYCKQVGIPWFASVWDEPSVDFLEQFDPICYKIPSASLTDHSLLRQVWVRNVRAIYCSDEQKAIDGAAVIAGHLGISKRTLYENFEDKNELLAQGIDHFRKIMHAEADNLLKNSANVIEGIYFIGRHGEIMRKSVNPLFFEDLRKFYPEIHKGISDRNRNRQYSIMNSLIRRGMDEGVFNKKLNPEIVNEFWHEIMNIFMNEEIFPRDKYSQENLIKNMIIPYLIGISTETGKKLIEQYFNKETNSNNKS